MTDTATRGDVRVSGAGAIATGTYKTVRVDGSATLVGDIECVSLHVSGAAEGTGTLTAESVVVNGSLGYRGDAKAGSVKVNGTATFGSLDVGTLKVAGTLDTTALRATEALVQGFLNVPGDCQAERFRADGTFTIDGLLNAGVVEATIYGSCRAREIGGEAVTVRRSRSSIRRLVAVFVPAMDDRLTAETIEGDDVRLEQTTAKAVRGNTVVIGPGCTIDLVEYARECTVSPDAKVTERRKVGDTAVPESDVDA